MRYMLLCLGWLWAVPAHPANMADPASLAEAAYRDGRFEAAADLAEGLETAAGEALAARAHLVLAAYLAPPPDRMRHLAAAEAAARRAIAQDPEHVEAMLHLVIALGYKARTLSAKAAHRAGFGREAKGLINEAKMLDPDNPWVYAIEGGWAGEIIAAAGGILGRLFYGASRKGMAAAFDRAQALAPDNPAIKVEYAKVLLRLNARKYRDQALTLLRAAQGLPPHDAFEALIKAQGKRLLAAMETGSDAKLAAALASVTPFVEPLLPDGF